MLKYRIYLSSIFVWLTICMTSHLYSQNHNKWNIRLNSFIGASDAMYQDQYGSLFFQLSVFQKRNHWQYGITIYEYSTISTTDVNIPYANYGYEDIVYNQAKRDYQYFIGPYGGYSIGDKIILTGTLGFGLLYHAERVAVYLENQRKFGYIGLGFNNAIELKWRLLPYTSFSITNMINYGISLENKSSELRYMYVNDDNNTLITQNSASKNLFFYGIFFGLSFNI